MQKKKRGDSQKSSVGFNPKSWTGVGPPYLVLSKVHGLIEAALQECTEKGVAAEKSFLTREEQRLHGEIDRTRARIRQDQTNLRRLGLPTVQNAFETWEKLTDDERRQLWKGTLLSALTVSLEAVKTASRPIGSFTPPQANALITRLRAKGITEPFLEEAIRKVAMTSGKPEMMKNVRDLADAIGQGLKTGSALADLSDGQLEALITLPAAFLKSPEAIATEALGETIVNFVFAEKALGVITPDLNGVLALPDRELANIQRLSAAVTRNVDRLNDAKRQLGVVVQQRRQLSDARRNAAPNVGY